MADDHGNNTEEPTEKRLSEAWAEGRFAGFGEIRELGSGFDRR